MKNKYQEALNNYSENVDYRDYSTKTVDIVNESYDTLQELVDKTKTPILEQVKIEWEKLGYVWEKREHIIFLYNKKNGKMISINTTICGYSAYNFDCVSLIITFQEHQLITKTFKAKEIEK